MGHQALSPMCCVKPRFILPANALCEFPCVTKGNGARTDCFVTKSQQACLVAWSILRAAIHQFLVVFVLIEKPEDWNKGTNHIFDSPFKISFKEISIKVPQRGHENLKNLFDYLQSNYIVLTVHRQFVEVSGRATSITCS